MEKPLKRTLKKVLLNDPHGPNPRKGLAKRAKNIENVLLNGPPRPNPRIQLLAPRFGESCTPPTNYGKVLETTRFGHVLAMILDGIQFPDLGENRAWKS